MTWILIMTLYRTDSSALLATEFNTEQSCRNAGSQQEMILRTDLGFNTSKYYTFICVPKG